MMRMIVKTTRDSGFKWHHHRDVCFKGYFFDADGLLYEGNDACRLFQGAPTVEVALSTVKQANGSFAVVINRPDVRLAAVDRLRSIPLFYRCDELAQQIILMDDPDVDQTAAELDRGATQDFLMSGFTIGNATLREGLNQLRAGEALLATRELSTIKYYSHIAPIRQVDSLDEEFRLLSAITNNWVSRLISSLNGRQLILPLSGGYDSRYIAAAVAAQGYKNVVTYTYGKRSSPEVSRSKQVADRLRFSWHFVEHQPEKWRSFVRSENHEHYARFGHLGASTPHYQEYLAVGELLKNGIIQQQGVVAPGFCGDFLGGSYVPFAARVECGSRLQHLGLTRYVAESQLYLRDPSKRIPEDTLERIRGELHYLGMTDKQLSAQQFVQLNDAFFAHHKIAKYVVNSLRLYEFFNLEWRMPLWDNELTEYWYSIPYKFRGKHCLYDDFLERGPFRAFDINIKRHGSGRIIQLRKRIYESNLATPAVLYLDRLVLAGTMRLQKKSSDINEFHIARDHYVSQLPNASRETDFVTAFTKWIAWRFYSAI